MYQNDSRDRVKYSKLETNDLRKVQAFLEQSADQLERAELSIRTSAGNYIAELRSTDEPMS
jgi:tRNA U54 and U55 pseudouridine synthase Pus10